MIGVELNWQRCPEGTEFIDYPRRLRANRKAVVLGEPPEGRHIRYRTDRRETFSLRLVDLKDSLIEKFIRCESEDDLLKFTGEYGLLAADAEQSVQSLKASRSAAHKMLGQWHMGHHVEASKLFNSAALPLTPKLVTWPSRELPHMALMATAPAAYMLMEAGIAIANATSLRTCNHCSLPYLAGTLTSKRTNAFYCSNKCRVAAQRAAQEG